MSFKSIIEPRERAAGTYHVSAYFMAKITVETIFQMPNPLIFSFIVYWLVGLQPVLSKFLVFLGFMVRTLNHLAATHSPDEQGRYSFMSKNLPFLFTIAQILRFCAPSLPLLWPYLCLLYASPWTFQWRFCPSCLKSTVSSVDSSYPRTSCLNISSGLTPCHTSR